MRAKIGDTLMLDTRQRLMRDLLHHRRNGRTVDELSAALGVSRNAAQQHLATLGRDGLVVATGQRATGGRPSRTYGLTDRGIESFPRHYALLATKFIETTRAALGDEAVEMILQRMADDLAEHYRPRLEGKVGAERLSAVADIMNELGYDAAATEDGMGLYAVNCIYHRLARQTRAICGFDVRLLSKLVGTDLAHTTCMLDGQARCAFVDLGGSQPGKGTPLA